MHILFYFLIMQGLPHLAIFKVVMLLSTGKINIKCGVNGRVTINIENHQDKVCSFHTHPLLQLITADKKIPSYFASWNLSQLSYLADYQIFDNVMCAGSNFIEIGLAVGRDLFSAQPYSLKNLFISNPLILNAKAPTNIEIKTTPINQKSYKLEINQDDITHAGVELHALKRERALVNSAKSDVSGKLKHQLNHANFYQGLKEVGLSYGPTFRRLRDIEFDSEKAYASLSPYHEQANFICHPTSIYSCFQLFTIMLAYLSQRSDVIYVPESLEQINYFHSKTVCERVEIKRIESNCFHLTLFDKDNGVIIDMPYFYIKSVPKAKLYEHIKQKTENLSELHKSLQVYLVSVLQQEVTCSNDSYLEKPFLDLCNLIFIWATGLVKLFDLT